MGLIFKCSCAIGILAAIALTAPGADARPRHGEHRRHTPYACDRARGYAAPYNADRRDSEEYSGTSVPYDPTGPGWNDFQLQGRT